MQIEVKLYGVLRKYRPKDADGAPHHPFAYSIMPDTTVTAVAAALGIPEGVVNAAAVNGASASPDVVLHDGDQLSLFPPSAGGSTGENKP